LNFKDILKTILGVDLSANLFLGKFSIQDMPLPDSILIITFLFLCWILYEGLEWYILNYVKPRFTRTFELKSYEEYLKLQKGKKLLEVKYNINKEEN
jgi:hypothetical protein